MTMHRYELHRDVSTMLGGGAVTPPVMTWIIGRVINALEAVS